MGQEEGLLRSLLSLYVPAFFLNLGMGIATPVVPLFAKSFGVSFGIASLVVTAYGLGQVVTDVPMGFLVDRVGRRRTAIVGASLTALSAFASGSAQSFVELLVYRTVSGVGLSMWGSARQTIIADVVPPRIRGSINNSFMVISTLGMTAGPAVGGFAASAWGLRSPFFVYFGVAFISTLLSIALIRETKPREVEAVATVSKSRVNRFTLATLLAFAFVAFANGVRPTARNTVIPFYGTYVLNLGLTEVGILITLVAAGSFLLVLPTGMIMDRFGRKKTLVPGLVLTGLMCVAYAYTGNYAQAMYVSILLGVGSGLGSGAVSTMSIDMAPANARGLFIGVWRMIGDIGTMAGPLVVGAVMDAYGIRPAFLVLASLLILASLTTQLFVKETLGETSKQQLQGETKQ